MRPDASFMVRHPAHWIALGFGSGLSPKAPGTMGTLWAWLSWWAFQDFFSVGELAGIIFLSSLIGIWACKVTAQNLEISDPGAIVWDEVVAFWSVLLLLSPADFTTQLAAFVLFRFFDAAKPGPVAWADQLFKGFGWRGAFGIFFDDFVAAFCTLLCFASWRAW
jgi:phosphatidylglycerophosphatase A